MFILVSLCVQRVFVFPGQDPGHPSMGRIPIWYDPAPPLLLWNTLSVLFNFIHPVLWSTDLHQQENSQKLVARWKNFFLSFTYHTLWSACALRVFSAPTGRARCCGLCAVAPPPWRGRSSLQCVEGRTGRAQPAPNHWPPPSTQIYPTVAVQLGQKEPQVACRSGGECGRLVDFHFPLCVNAAGIKLTVLCCLSL